MTIGGGCICSEFSADQVAILDDIHVLSAFAYMRWSFQLFAQSLQHNASRRFFFGLDSSEDEKVDAVDVLLTMADELLAVVSALLGEELFVLLLFILLFFVRNLLNFTNLSVTHYILRL